MVQWFHYSYCGCPRGTPPTRWFVFILNGRSCYTLYGVCMWSKQSVWVCAFLVFYACTCRTRCWLCVCVCVHVSLHTWGMMACRHQTPWFLLLLFLPMRQRGRWRKKNIFQVSGGVCLGAFRFRNNCWDITAKWAVEQRGIVGLWKMKHLHLGPGNEGVFLRDDSEEEDQRAMEGGER